MDVASMTRQLFPRKPYDEVASEFIHEEICQGSFDDLDYRRYVNGLVWLEWYTTEGRETITGGIPRLGAAVHRRKVAVHPEAYDAIRRDLGASTRTEEGWHWQGEEDPDERRQWARRHSEEWQAVQRGEQRPPAARAELTTGSSRPFAPFRFPVLPYDSIQSPFIREEIQRGSFDDFEYRRTVNKLAWLEWDATARDGGGYYGTPVKRWHIAAEYPQEFDIVRRELDEETRDSVKLRGGIGHRGDDAEAVARKHKRAWQAVQKDTEGNSSVWAAVDDQ